MRRTADCEGDEAKWIRERTEEKFAHRCWAREGSTRISVEASVSSVAMVIPLATAIGLQEAFVNVIYLWDNLHGPNEQYQALVEQFAVRISIRRAKLMSWQPLNIMGLEHSLCTVLLKAPTAKHDNMGML